MSSRAAADSSGSATPETSTGMISTPSIARSEAP
jgi:hypothetical protein